MHRDGVDARSLVTQVPPAPPPAARAHFGALARFETDCADVHAALASGGADFTLLDVRGPDAYRAGHVEGAVSLPHREIDAEALAGYGPTTVFVVYCNGPHCNGADRGALAIARLGRPVKKMIGGIAGWEAEGFPLARRTRARSI